VAERLPLFDKDLIARRKKFNELKNAADKVDVDAIEFDEDEFDFRPTKAREMRAEVDYRGESSESDEEGDFEIRNIKVPDPMQNVIPEDDSEESTTEEGTSDGDYEENTSEGDGEESGGDSGASSRLDRELARLGADINDINIEEGMRTRSHVYFIDICNDKIVLNAEAVNSDAGTPKNFKEAYYGEDSKKWKPSMLREMMNFMKRDAWEKIVQTSLPKGQRPLKVKWVYKIKDEEKEEAKYKSRIVIKGYTEIPGVNYTESFAPVATSTAINMILGTALYRGWEVETVDIEAAFLEADMDPNMQVLIEWPEGSVEFGIITREIYEE
jgi:hypothetical protein